MDERKGVPEMSARAILAFLLFLVAALHACGANATNFTTQQNITGSNVVVDCAVTGHTYSNASGTALDIRGFSNVTVKNCRFITCSTNCIYASNGSNLTVENNVFENSRRAVLMNNGVGAITGAMKVRNNKIYSSLGTNTLTCGAIQIAGGSTSGTDVLVPGSEISGNVITMVRSGFVFTGTIYRSNCYGDIINIYNTSGTSAAPVQIFGNYIWTEYDGLTEAQIATVGTTRMFTGAAIQFGDFPSVGKSEFIQAFDNTVMDFGGGITGGIPSSDGSDSKIYNNLVKKDKHSANWFGQGAIAINLTSSTFPCTRPLMRGNRVRNINYLGAHDEIWVETGTSGNVCTQTTVSGNQVSHLANNTGPTFALQSHDGSWKTLDHKSILACSRPGLPDVPNGTGGGIWVLHDAMRPNAAVTKSAQMAGEFGDIDDDPDAFSTNNTTDNDQGWITDTTGATHELTAPLTSPLASLSTSATVHKVRVLARKNASSAATGDPSYVVSILEGGITRQTLAAQTVTSTAGQQNAREFTWDGAWNSSNMEVKVVTTASSGGRLIDYGAIEVDARLAARANMTPTDVRQPVAGETCVVNYATVPTAMLSCTPGAITLGASSDCAWSSTNATSCTGVGFSTGGATSGTVSVTPTVTSSYSLTCTGAGGTSPQAQATVTVDTETINIGQDCF